MLHKPAAFSSLDPIFVCAVFKWKQCRGLGRFPECINPDRHNPDNVVMPTVSIPNNSLPIWDDGIREIDGSGLM